MVLTRWHQESVRLIIPGRPNHVVVTVARVEGGRVRLGFEADQDIEIVRSELIEGGDMVDGGNSNPGRPTR